MAGKFDAVTAGKFENEIIGKDLALVNAIALLMLKSNVAEHDSYKFGLKINDPSFSETFFPALEKRFKKVRKEKLAKVKALRAAAAYIECLADAFEYIESNREN